MAALSDPDDKVLHGSSRKKHPPRKMSTDSLEIESHGIAGHKQENWLTALHLAFQSIGVVYGDIGTSPLYTIAAVFSSEGVKAEEDIYGALSIIFYTLTLIPLVKYVMVVLEATDNGDGGTFALYSLICRHAKVGLIPNEEVEDKDVSTFNLDVPKGRKKASLVVKSSLENSKFAKYFLLIASMLGTSMVIGDGVLTPCISVLSAVNGIKGAAESITADHVMWMSVAILVGLFMIQRFGTDKIGYSFAPILTIWFMCISLIGIYNWVKYDLTIIKSLNPYYIYTYFKRNKRGAWLSLGGTILCVTGAEALFADVGHFSIKAIRMSMCTMVYPCLVCAYLGQGAYLKKHPEVVADIFYKSIPGPLYWPVFAIAVLAAIIASQAMISGSFAMIQQSLALGCFPRVKVVHTSDKYEGQVYIPEVNYIFMILCVAVIFIFRNADHLNNAYGIAVVMVMTLTSAFIILIMVLIWRTNVFFILGYILIIVSVELVYLSSLLYKFIDGGYLPIAFALFLMIIMYVWNDVFRRKYYYELKHKISPEEVKDTINHARFPHRIPGVAIFYSELVHGIPPIFKHYMSNIPALHTVLVFVTFKSLHTSKVPREQRFLFRRVHPNDLNVFRCVVRYGYAEPRTYDEPFEQLLLDNLKQFIKDDFQFSAGVLQSSQGEISTDIDTSFPTSMLDQKEEMEREIQVLDEAGRSGILHLIGDNDILAHKESDWFKKITIDYLYHFIERNLKGESDKILDIPHERLVKVGMLYEL